MPNKPKLATGLLDPIVSPAMVRALRLEIAEIRQIEHRAQWRSISAA
jgi:hypothetical protein